MQSIIYTLLATIAFAQVIYTPPRITYIELPVLDYEPNIGYVSDREVKSPETLILSDFSEQDIPQDTIKEIILENAMKYDIDYDLMHDLAWFESRFNHKARNAEGSTAVGIYQWLEGSWDYYCGDLGDIDARFNPYLNIECAARRLSEPSGINTWTADRRVYTYLVSKGHI